MLTPDEAKKIEEEKAAAATKAAQEVEDDSEEDEEEDDEEEEEGANKTPKSAKKEVEDDSEEDEEEDDEEGGDEDPYDKELQRLADEKKKAEAKARQKSGALKEVKAKYSTLENRLKKLEESRGSADYGKFKEELKAEMRMEAEIEQITDNPKERQLIEFYVKEKNLTVDEAYALANRHVIKQMKEREREGFEEESALARISAGASIGGRSAGGLKDPILRAAAEGLTKAEREKLKNISY